MAKYSTRYIEAGLLVRPYIEDAFRQMRADGCTVTFTDVHRGLLSTTWYGVKIEGPDAWIRRFARWMENMDG